MDSPPPPLLLPSPPPPPSFRCLRTCQNGIHLFNNLEISSIPPLQVQPPSSPPPPPPPKPPKYPQSAITFCPPFIPGGFFLSEGIVPFHEPSSSSSSSPPPPSRSALVVVGSNMIRDNVQERLDDLHYSRSIIPKLVPDVAMASIFDNIENCQTVDVLVSDQNPAEELHEGIPFVTTRVKKYHQRFENLMMRTWAMTNRHYPLVPVAGRPELPPVPELVEGCRPSVSMKLFPTHWTSADDETSRASINVSFKKTMEDSTVEHPSGQQVLEAVVGSLRRPERVVFENADVVLEVMLMDYTRGYRRMARMTKKTAELLEGFEGHHQTW